MSAWVARIISAFKTTMPAFCACVIFSLLIHLEFLSVGTLRWGLTQLFFSQKGSMLSSILYSNYDLEKVRIYGRANTSFFNSFPHFLY